MRGDAPTLAAFGLLACRRIGIENYLDPKAHGMAAPNLDLDESLALTRRCKYAIRNL